MLDTTTIQMALTVCLHLHVMFSPCLTRGLPVWPKKIGSAQALLYIFPTSDASSQVRQKTVKGLRVTQNESYDNLQTTHSANSTDDVKNT